jgi:hypothetical protein
MKESIFRRFFFLNQFIHQNIFPAKKLKFYEINNKTSERNNFINSLKEKYKLI